MTTLRTSSMALGVLMAAVIMGMLPAAGWGGEPESPALELLSIGQPRPSAIGLRVWTNKEAGQTFQEGDRFVITVQADSDAYLTVLCVSPEGKVLVLFPHKGNKDRMLEKGKPATLFGDDSDLRLRLGKPIETPRLTLYLSPKPPNLSSLKASKETGLITIPGNAVTEIEALKGAIEAISRDEGFNRVVPAMNGDAKTYFEVKVSEGPGRLMGGSRPVLKKLPTPVDSTPPETVTGVQGVKPETEK